MSLFLPVIDAFNRGNVTYAVVGGLAAVLHGHSRLTSDVDIVVGLDEPNAAKAVDIISGLGYQPRVPVDPRGFADPEQRAQWIREKGLTVFSFFKKDYPLIGIDLFVDYPMEFKGFMERSVVKDLGGVPVRLCSINDLIAMKKKAGRPKDLEDARILEIIRDEKP